MMILVQNWILKPFYFIGSIIYVQKTTSSRSGHLAVILEISLGYSKNSSPVLEEDYGQPCGHQEGLGRPSGRKRVNYRPSLRPVIASFVFLKSPS